MSKRSLGMQVFLALMGVTCACLAVMAVLAIASGGYRPERYEGQFDPVRAAMIVAFAAGTAGFAMVAAVGIWTRLAGGRASLSAIACSTGLAIEALAILLVVARLPTSGPTVIPSELQLLVRLGLGVMVAGLVPPMVRNAMAAIKRG